MKLNNNILLFFQYLLLIQSIISLPDNTTNNSSLIEDEETLEFQKTVSEYYKLFYSDINPIILTDENYTNYIKSNPYTLIYIHSPIDIRSKNFIPTHKYIHNFFNKKNSSPNPLPLKFVAIDLIDNENNEELQTLFRLNTFPFFIIYSSIYNSYIQYTGYMTAQSIITFCTKATMDNIITINKENNNLLQNLFNPELTYMGLLSISDRFNFDDYFRASQEMKFAIFGDCIGQKKCLEYLHNLKNKTKIDINNTDIILIKNNLCENDFICDNNIIDKESLLIPYNYTTYDKFIELISLNIIPPLHNLTDFNYEITLKNNFKTIIYIKGIKENKSNKEISLILNKIIKEKKYEIQWGSILDPINSANDYESAKLFSVEVEDYYNKSLVIIYSRNKLLKNEFNVYRLNNTNIKEINEDIIANFIHEFNSGFIKKDIKSELIPKTHPKKNLRMVVGKTFNKEILENYNKTNVLILLTLNMNNLHTIEDQIESLTIKFIQYNKTLVFNFLDPALNEMPNMPNYNINEKPYYRYYFKNKTIKYKDFKGNSSDQSEIEDWIIENYAKEYGEDEKYAMRMHIEKMTELLKDENVFREMEKQQKFEQIKEEFGIRDDIILDNDTNPNTNNNIETDL
jgi:hypothetical protein